MHNLPLGPGKAKQFSTLVTKFIQRSKGANRKNSLRRNASSTGGSIGSGGGGGKSLGGNGGGGEGASSPGGVWGAYVRALESSPILTKSITAAVLNAVGDVLSQTMFEKNDHISFKRIFQFAFLGLVLVGPALHFWYGFLATKVPVSGFAGTLTRLFIDQALFAPFFIGTFFSALLLLEGHPELIENKLKQDLKGAVIANWKVWIPVQFVNFRFVPVNLQVLFANTIAIGWNTFMSYKAHQKVPAASLPG